jgi:hypothetical protein
VAEVWIVDTNVPLVANGACAGVSPKCRLAAIDFLENLLVSGDLVLDLGGEIEAEYRKKLNVGQPGTGSRFLQMFLSQAAGRVRRIDLKKDRSGNYESFKFQGSLRRFDPSDRKFVAAAALTGAPVANCTDSDWLEHRDELERRGITITFICGDASAAWFERAT